MRRASRLPAIFVNCIGLVEEGRYGNWMERIVQATANSFVLNPKALGGPEPMPADTIPAAGLVAAAGRLIRDGA